MSQLEHFEFARNLSSDEAGYSFFSDISLDTYATKNGVLFFDFSGNEWFDANLCSPLGVLIESLRRRNNTVHIYGLSESVERVFKQNGFYHLIVPDYKDGGVYKPSIIDYKRFHLKEVAKFQDYITEHLLQHDDFPMMSELLYNKIAKSILELFNNADVHGKTKYVYTCGQYIKRRGLLKFTISDMGVTIRKNVNDFHKTGNKIDGVESIKWAVQEGNTTKTGEIPGGLGLSLIRDFLTLNQGKIQIISSNGFWQESEGIPTTKSLNKRFLGTIVTLEFNLNDKKSYILAEEIDPTDML